MNGDQKRTDNCIHVDVSFDNNTGEYGYGLILWMNGQISDFKIVPGYTTSAECEEALAVKGAALWTKDLNLHGLHVQTYSANVAIFFWVISHLLANGERRIS